jgi:hypothetical protein
MQSSRRLRHDGRERAYDMAFIEEYHRFKRRDRQVLGLEDFSEADVAALEAVRAPESAKDFDHEIKSKGGTGLA